MARLSSERTRPAASSWPGAAAGRSQRLHALSAVLCLGSLLLVMSVAFMVLSVVRQSPPDDSRANANLTAVIDAANGVYRDTGSFDAAQPVALEAKLVGVGIHVVDENTRSDNAGMISMSEAGEGWYGAVRSATGRCFAVGTVRGDPQLQRHVLPGNCTGEAARASLIPPGATFTPATDRGGAGTSAGSSPETLKG